MSVETVTKDIAQEAQTQIKDSLAQARKEAKTITQKAHDEAKAYREQAVAEQQGMLGTLERKRLASARADLRQERLSRQQALIAQAVTSARESLQSLPSAKRKAFLQRLLKQAKQEIAVGRVLVSEQDKTLLKGEKNVETADIAGGLIAESKDGKVSVNYTLETLIEQAKHRTMLSLMEVLFSD